MPGKKWKNIIPKFVELMVMNPMVQSKESQKKKNKFQETDSFFPQVISRNLFPNWWWWRWFSPKFLPKKMSLVVESPNLKIHCMCFPSFPQDACFGVSILVKGVVSFTPFEKKNYAQVKLPGTQRTTSIFEGTQPSKTRPKFQSKQRSSKGFWGCKNY